MPNSAKDKKYVSLYFHVHQPFRMNNTFSPYDVPQNQDYFMGPSGQDNVTIINRVVERNYRPAGQMFLDLIKNNDLKVSYSFTGTVLEQLREFAPDVIELYKTMYETGKMELICETYYHSLASFYDHDEFIRQVKMQCENLYNTFGANPDVFRNTELTYRNDVGEIMRRLGFKAMFAEGWDPILDWRSPNYMYRNKPEELSEDVQPLSGKQPQSELKLLLKNYKRSDDIAFRFQLQGWEGYPVTAEKFADWILEQPGYLVNLCMDYETVGEHHRIESGIFDFYKALPVEFAKRGIEFILPSEATDLFESEELLDYPEIVSWADAERDLSAWTGNEMQQKALEAIYLFGKELHKHLENLESQEEKDRLLSIWGKLQTSDHYYYMSTKYWSDGDVHKYFSPYDTPYQAAINFTNILWDFKSKFC